MPFLAAAVVSGGSVRVTGWPPASTQPADAILAILEKLGAVVRHTDSYLEVQGAPVYGGFDADLHDVGELTPVRRGAGRTRRAGLGVAAAAGSRICAATKPTGWPH